MTLGNYIYTALGAVGAGLAILWCVRHRRDRAPRSLISMAALAWACLIIVAAPTNSASLLLAMLLVGCFGFPLAGMTVLAWQARERYQAKMSAIAAGMDPREARERYRREPWPIWVVLGAYFMAAAVWVVGVLGLVWLVERTSPGAADRLLEHPSWSLPGAAVDHQFPWWILVTFVILGAAAIHAAASFVLRDVVRPISQRSTSSTTGSETDSSN